MTNEIRRAKHELADQLRLNREIEEMIARDGRGGEPDSAISGGSGEYDGTLVDARSIARIVLAAGTGSRCLASRRLRTCRG